MMQMKHAPLISRCKFWSFACSDSTHAQKKAVFFDQFQAVGLTMYGVNTLHAIPTTLL
jgi:hypothetical protein